MAQVASADSSSSLLSLSIAAATVTRIPTSMDVPSNNPSNFNPPSQSGGLTASKIPASSKHRRLSSTGLLKRRMSDAREAATRPSPATIQSAAAALSSLAALSLSGSPPPPSLQPSTSFTAASDMIRSHSTEGVSGQNETSVKQEDTQDTPVGKGELSVGGITIKNGTGKKRGTIFKCESCSKVYRHPSCLIKHRWEHSPHWREASKFLLSKHQQVQLLEAAAILSHISPSASGGSSLPEDRSLWPFYLSGGAMAPPSTMTVSADSETSARQSASSLEARPPFPTSSSVPSHSTLSPHMARSTSTGPRMHDYSIPATGGLTHVRPGVLAVPTGSESEHSTATRAVPVPVPVNTTTYRDPAASYSESWGSPASYSLAHSYGTGGWSLPDSSLRSESGSASRSRSGSIPRSEYEDELVDIDGDDMHESGYGFASRGRTSATRDGWKDGKGSVGSIQEKINEEDWDGMEMEMEM